MPVITTIQKKLKMLILVVVAIYSSCLNFDFQTNANIDISKRVISSEQYHVVTMLIQYYQMEARWTIRVLLLQTFDILCNLDENVINITLNSILPGELARYKMCLLNYFFKLIHVLIFMNLLPFCLTNFYI